MDEELKNLNASSEPFGVSLDELAELTETGGAMLLDVRRKPAFDAAQQMLPGAVWRDPEQLAQWQGGLATGQALVAYCVFGHEVSRSLVLRLRATGVDARFLRGGIDAWRQDGRPLVDKPAD